MKLNKRGQFYLAAAIIIVIILFSLYGVKNYAKPKTHETVVYDLKSEVDLESGKVVDYSIYTKNDTILILQNWTQLYVTTQESQKIDQWVFIFGDKNNLSLVTMNNVDTGMIVVTTGGNSFIAQTPKTIVPNVTDITSSAVAAIANDINISLPDGNYSFKLESGKNFIMLIKKEGYVA